VPALFGDAAKQLSGGIARIGTQRFWMVGSYPVFAEILGIFGGIIPNGRKPPPPEQQAPSDAALSLNIIIRIQPDTYVQMPADIT
jgi:hypothetical protein